MFVPMFTETPDESKQDFYGSDEQVLVSLVATLGNRIVTRHSGVNSEAQRS